MPTITLDCTDITKTYTTTDPPTPCSTESISR